MHPKILALDIGSVRVGVAVSDGLRMLAHPLTTIQWQSEEQFIKQLGELVIENKSELLVIGVPYTMKGTDSEQTKKVLNLIDKIKQSLKIKIETIDERLTTKMAMNMLKDVNKKASRNRHIIDQLAAVNILQTYLDKTRI